MEVGNEDTLAVEKEAVGRPPRRAQFLDLELLQKAACLGVCWWLLTMNILCQLKHKAINKTRIKLYY